MVTSYNIQKTAIRKGNVYTVNHESTIDKCKHRGPYNSLNGCQKKFLNRDLDEKIYMEPEDYVLSGNEQKVCKLVKSLYGSKQASKQ